MKTIYQTPVTNDLLRFFRKDARTLIFEGYCVNFQDVCVCTDGESYALTAAGESGETECCVFSDDMQFVEAFISKLQGRTKFCGISSKITRHLQKRCRFNWLTECDLYAWNGKPLNTALDGDFLQCDIRPIEEKYAAQVSNGTPYSADVNDVVACLRRHPSVAAYVNGEPVCWCLLHMEGSLGMLYTVPEFRRKGYALKVMTALTNKVIEAGDVPYAYIIKDNIASKSLALKYNLQPVCRADYLEIDFN